MGDAVHRIVNAPSLAAQRAAWEDAWFVRFCLTAPAWLVEGVTRILSALAFNRLVMWCVPCLLAAPDA